METIGQAIENMVRPVGRNVSQELIFKCPYKTNSFGGDRVVNLFDCKNNCYVISCGTYERVLAMEKQN